MSTNENVVLSRRARPLVGWVAIDEFEDLFAAVGGARVVVPEQRWKLPAWTARVRDRIMADVSIPSELGQGDLLLVVARSPRDLQVVRALRSRRKRFRHVVGYVIDSYFHEGYGSSTREYDHVFTTTPDGAEFVRTKFGVPTSVLCQGFDCLRWGCVDDSRSIDLLGFGRQPPSYHRQFQLEFHRRDSPILYLHSPIGSLHGPAVWTERAMMLKLMQRSKLGLAFHLQVEPGGHRPTTEEFVTSRWFEQLATGCLVVGRRPGLARDLFDWPDATIELPADPAASARMITELVDDAAFLAATRRRNVLEMCRRHDWRYRIRDIFGHFELALPLRLNAELAELDARTQQLAQALPTGDAAFRSLSSAPSAP